MSRQWIVEIEGGKARAPIELVLRTLEALGVVLKVDELDSAASEVIIEAPDIDAIVRNARKKAR